MDTAILVLSTILSIIVVVLILLQNKGTGLGGAWGGGGELFQTRRGVEKITLYLTVVCIVLFFAVSFAKLIIN